jgi:hypothetical protein
MAQELIRPAILEPKVYAVEMIDVRFAKENPMIERDVQVITKYGPMPCFAACPQEVGKFRPVIFYMDAPGTREELHNMAGRAAASRRLSSEAARADDRAG